MKTTTPDFISRVCRRKHARESARYRERILEASLHRPIGRVMRERQRRAARELGVTLAPQISDGR